MLIPKKQDRKGEKGARPKWLKIDKIKKHAKRSTSVSAKAKELLERQSKPQMKEIVLSYMCSQCKKSFSTESLRKQLIEAARRADTYVSCPKCGVALVADRKTKVPTKLSRKVKRAAELTSVYSNQGITPGYVPNSWIDRAILEKVAHELGKFAQKCGMFSPQLKFQGGIRGKVREGAPENVKFAEYTIESTDSNDIRFRVLAIAGISPAGKVLLPKTFKTLMGEEISFTEAGVQEFVSGKVFGPTEPKFVTPKLYYRDPDPTRFREIVASTKKAQVDFEEAPEGVKRIHPGTEEWKNIIDTFVGDYVSDVREGVLLDKSTIMEDVANYEVNEYVNFGDDINSMVDDILTALRTKGIRIVEGKKKTAAGTPTPGQTVMYQEKEYTVDSITGDASVLTDEAGVLTAPIPNTDLNIQMGEGIVAPVAPTASVKDKIGKLVKKSLRDEKTLVPFTDPKPDYSVAEQSKVDPDFGVPYEDSDQGILDEKDRAVQRMFRGGTSIKPTKSAAEIRWQKVIDDLEKDVGDAGGLDYWLEKYSAINIEDALVEWLSEHDLILEQSEYEKLRSHLEGYDKGVEASLKKTAPEKAELERMVQKCMKEKGWDHDKCEKYIAGGIWGKKASLHPGMHGVTNDGFKFTILEVMGNEIKIWEEETDASRVVNKTEWETEKSPEYGGSKEIEASKIAAWGDKPVRDKFNPGDKVVGIQSDQYYTIVREIDEGDPSFQKLLRKYRKDYGLSFFNTADPPEEPFYVVESDGDEEIAGSNELMKEGSKRTIQKTAEPTGYHETDDTGKVIELSRLRKLIEDYARAGQFPPDFDLTKIMSEVSRMTRKDLLEILDKKLKDTHYPVVHAKKKTAALSENAKNLILRGAKTIGTFDPDEIFPLIEEELYMDEVNQVRSFLTWAHKKNKEFGLENIDGVYDDYIRELGGKESSKKRTTKGKSTNDIIRKIRKADLTEKEVKEDIKDEEEGAKTYKEQAKEVDSEKAEKVLEKAAEDELKHAEELEEVVLPAVKNTENYLKVYDSRKKKGMIEYPGEAIEEGDILIDSDNGRWKVTSITSDEPGEDTYIRIDNWYKVVNEGTGEENEFSDSDIYENPYWVRVEKAASKKTAQEEVEEKPVTEYRELKTKPHGKPAPEEVKEAPTAAPEMQKVFHEIRGHQQRLTEIKSIISDARRDVEKRVREISEEHKSAEEEAQMKEEIEKLAALLDESEKKIADLGEFFVYLNTEAKTKKFKPSDRWRVAKLLEKFGEDARNYLEKAEQGAKSMNEEIAQRILTVFPKREGAIEKRADVFDSIKELGSGLWNYIKSLSEILEEGAQLELALE